MISYVTKLREELCDTINNSPLQIDIKYYILKDVFQEVDSIYRQFLATPEPQQEDKNKKLSQEKEVQIQEIKKDNDNVEVNISGGSPSEVIATAINIAATGKIPQNKEKKKNK